MKRETEKDKKNNYKKRENKTILREKKTKEIQKR